MRKALPFGLLAVAVALALAFAKPAPAQSTWPVCQIQVPTNNSTVSGTVTVGFWYYDPNGGFKKFELWVDGQLAQTLTMSKRLKSVSFKWNTTTVPNGVHTVWVCVYSSSGEGESAPFTYTVVN